jgi:hypothetical protein
MKANTQTDQPKQIRAHASMEDTRSLATCSKLVSATRILAVLRSVKYASHPAAHTHLIQGSTHVLAFNSLALFIRKWRSPCICIHKQHVHKVGDIGACRGNWVYKELKCHLFVHSVIAQGARTSHLAGLYHHHHHHHYRPTFES